MKATIHARFSHHDDGDVRVRRYADDTLAVTIETPDEMGFPDRETLSVNLGAYGMDPGEGHTFVPDYAQHEGLPVAMEEAGLGTVVDRVTFGPFHTEAAVFRLSDALLAEE